MKKLALLFALLPVFALAEITYPVDVENTRWAIIDMQSGEIIFRQRAWPVADGSPVSGLSTNFVYLLHSSDARPEYDSRVFSLNSTEVVDVPANELRKTYATVRRPTEEITAAAQNVEMAQSEQQGIDLARELIQTRLMLTALIQHSIDQQTLPPKIRQFATRYKNRGIRLWTNRARLEELVDKIEQNQDFDLDAGWEPPTP